MSRIPAVPSHLDAATKTWMNHVRNELERLQPTSTNPNEPTSLQVLPGPGSNVIRFTLSNADNYQLFIGTNPDYSAASVVELGKSNSYTDSVGKAAIAKWYWVRGSRTSGARSNIVGPVQGTTLALNVPVTAVVPQIPVSQQYVYDWKTGRMVPADLLR